MTRHKSGTIRIISRRNDRGGVKSCIRTLEILQYFSGIRSPVRTTEVSEALGLPNSSTDEILRTLADMGYLILDRETRRYSPSYKMVVSGRMVENSFFKEDFIKNLLHDIRRVTGESVYFTFQNDCWVESAAEMRGRWFRPAYEVDYPGEVVLYHQGSWKPGCNFAGALLAQQSNVAILRIVDRAQRNGLGPGDAVPSPVTSLIDRISQIRTKGYALCRRRDVGLDSIAVPITLPNGVPHAVGIVGKSLFETDSALEKLASTMHSIIKQHMRGLYGQRKLAV